MVLSNDSNCACRRHFDVVFVVLPEKYALGIIEADSCGKQCLSSAPTQLTHPLMADYKVLREREEKNTREFAPFCFHEPNSDSPDARDIRLVEKMYELSHPSPVYRPISGRARRRNSVRTCDTQDSMQSRVILRYRSSPHPRAGCRIR